MSALAVRRLGRRDMSAIERHLLALGPADRRKRFRSPADDAAVARYVAGIDPDRAVLVGATDEDGRVVGVAEARSAAGAPRTVELAATVHPYHRREGVGRRLAARAASLAFAGGADAALLFFAPENAAGAALARSLGARLAAPGRALLVRAAFNGCEDEAAALRTAA